MHTLTSSILSSFAKAGNKVTLPYYEDPFKIFTDYGLSDLKNFSRILNVHDGLADEKSRVRFRDVIRWRILHPYVIAEYLESICYLYTAQEYSMYINEASKLKNIIDDNIADVIETYFLKPYINTPVLAEPGDVVFDCGAYTGNTAIIFSQLVTELGKIYSFEPHPEIFAKLSKNTAQYQNVSCYNYGLSNTDGTQSMLNWDLSSRIDVRGDITINTTSIDNFIELHNINKVDYIKMDIEGEELNALRGCVNTIRRFHPKLAVCVYHKPSDIYSIFEFLNTLDLGYEFYFGHYGPVVWESILFARPANRAAYVTKEYQNDALIAESLFSILNGAAENKELLQSGLTARSALQFLLRKVTNKDFMKRQLKKIIRYVR